MYGVDRAAVDRFWTALAAALRRQGLAGVPDQLDWPDDLDAHWRVQDLLLSQTCGYPLVEGLGGHVRVVGAFHYAVEGASGPDYSSLLVARVDGGEADVADFRGRRVAYNGTNSQSGYNSLRALVAPFAESGRFFGGTIETGAHRRSLALVQSGGADIAAIDCVSLALIARYDPGALDGIRIVGRTASAPGLPLITSGETTDSDLERIRAALEDVIVDPALEAERDALFIAGFSRLNLADYDRCAAMKRAAIERGYPELA